MRFKLTIFFTICFSFVFAQDKYSKIDLADTSFKEFEVFGDTLDAYKVYFTGENHTYATFNTTFQYKLLTYLHQNQGVSHFIFEQGPGLTYIINEIILEDKTAHLSYLKELFYTPFYDLIQKLRTFNSDLAPNDKIRIHGIDTERFPYFSVYALKDITDTIDVKGEEGVVFEQIKALATSRTKAASPGEFYSDDKDALNFQFGQVSAWESLKSIILGAREHEAALKLKLGEDSTVFFSIIQSLAVGQEWYMTEKRGDIKSPIIRERFMVEEFERIYRQYPNGKFYGQFGRCHLHKQQHANRCYDYYMNSIANRINEIDSSLTNQVLVIPIFYQNSREFDSDVIKSLELDEKFTTGTDAYIIDLAYKKGDHSIVGFYNRLPFVIICNSRGEQYSETDDYWENSLEEFHAGVYITYNNFRGMSKLNSILTSRGFGTFNPEWNGYSFAVDYIDMGEMATHFAYDYYPEISNGDRFTMHGYSISSGSSYPVGNKFVMAAFGLDFGYGRMNLIEEQQNIVPNLIQMNGKNIVRYKNDFFTLDPNLELRLTLPLISFNIRSGYAYDISGKYWKLDGKVKDFTKTSFSSFYAQLGISLNIKTK